MLIKCFEFHQQYHGYGTCLMGLPQAVREHMGSTRNGLARGELLLYISCFPLSYVYGLTSFLIYKMGIH